MQCDGVDAAEGLVRSETVDPVLFTVVTGVSGTVATSIPWFDADERSIPGRRRPYTHNRSVECQGKPRGGVRTMESHLGDL